MNIVNLSPDAPYDEGWSYQENLLPKYQVKLGHNVTLITTTESNNSEINYKVEECDYISEDGFRVIRREKKSKYFIIKNSFFDGFYIFDLLKELKPDMVFFHGLCSVVIGQVVKYKKEINKDLVIVQDNHLDNNIGWKKDKIVTYFLARLIYRSLNKKNSRYIDKVYGVTPWRKKYAEEFFKLPSNKTDVLMMGADDEKLDFANKKQIRKTIRDSLNVMDEDFLIVTGGKVDRKKEIHTLLNACKNIEGVKVLIFGQILDDVKVELNILFSNFPSKFINIGWIKSEKAYDYYFAGDLICFPGQHSVLWEQACASKTPCLFTNSDGSYYLNNGGNSDFLDEVSELSIYNKIKELKFTDKYLKMKEIAESPATDIYLNSEVAKKSLECLNVK